MTLAVEVASARGTGPARLRPPRTAAGTVRGGGCRLKAATAPPAATMPERTQVSRHTCERPWEQEVTSGVCAGCSAGMVLVTEEDCRAGKVEPCLPTCAQLSFSSPCTAACDVGKKRARDRQQLSSRGRAQAVLAPPPGCRCPPGLFLQGGQCVNASQCSCPWEGRRLQPGQTVSRDQCTTWWETPSLMALLRSDLIPLELPTQTRTIDMCFKPQREESKCAGVPQCVQGRTGLL